MSIFVICDGSVVIFFWGICSVEFEVDDCLKGVLGIVVCVWRRLC